MPIEDWSKYINDGNFFVASNLATSKQIKSPAIALQQIINNAEEIMEDKFCFFFHHRYKLEKNPIWFYDPWQNYYLDTKIREAHWSQINNLNDKVDIKVIWETSRFYWVITLAKAYVVSKNNKYLTRLEQLLHNWCSENPINQGPNWVCGQEVSIRLIQMLLAWYILGSDLKPTQNLIRFIVMHCCRIEKTLSYAISQRNNHITTEASALYIAGCWLNSIGGLPTEQKELAYNWQRLGTKLLEKNISKLVMHDGTFSQYSLNYQRLLLDTLSIVIFWQRTYKFGEFSARLLQHYSKAFEWLFDFVNANTGAAPNIGNNDGSMYSSISDTDYQDFRSSVQLAAKLITGRKCYIPGNYDDMLAWLNLSSDDFLETNLQADTPYTAITKNYANGGFLTYAINNMKFFFRYPRFKFRPAQSDCLHFDLWVDGENILTDSGTYCYNPYVSPAREYFLGIASHNTIQFDNREPMLRLTHFLFDNWMQSKITIAKTTNLFSSAYRDYKGAKHARTIKLEENRLLIIDNVEGYNEFAVLRWNLANVLWCVQDNKYLSNKIQLEIFLNGKIASITTSKTYNSLYYLSQQERITLEVIARERRAEFLTVITYNL